MREGENTETLALGFDLGGTKILTAVVNTQGEIVSHDRRRTPATKGHQAIIQSMLKSADRALDLAGIATAELGAVGIGAAGLSDPETGVLFTSPHLPGWRDVPLRDIIEKGLGKKSFLINDADAAALGEFHFGAGRGTRHLIYITVSTGIGGGIIINGQIYTGASGAAGEIGHMTIDVNGPPCNCGNRGCWETLASGTALAREARHRISEGAKTSILEHADGDINKLTAEAVHSAAKDGDSLAKELIARTGYYLGVGLANLINMFNPELIVIGGGLSNIGDMLFAPAFKVAEERAFREAYRAVRFSPAKLGLNSGVLGAAAFALQEVKRVEKR